jgi:hypothetical protein
MTSRARLLATVLLLAPAAQACGRNEAREPVTNRPASPTPGVTATEAVAMTSPPAATGTIAPRPVQAAAPAVSATARPPATAAPKAHEATPIEQQAPPPPAAATSEPQPATQSEKPPPTAPAAPPGPAPQRPRGKVTLPAKLGAVTFDHEKHAGKLSIACTTCHHPSRPQAPLASEMQACRDCHTMPATPPMKTSLQVAFHDPRGATGTCINCHKQKGGSAPVKCLECHRKK